VLIRAGRVTLNGRVVEDAETPVHFPNDRIEIDGSLLEKRESVYLAMNKPRGIVTTASDEKGRQTVYDLLSGSAKSSSMWSAREGPEFHSGRKSHPSSSGFEPLRESPFSKTLFRQTMIGPQAWVAPVGRLDKASEGLLLLTNDSAWAAQVTDPATHLDKVYHVHIDQIATPELLKAVTEGYRLDGEVLRAKRSRLLRHGEKTSWLELTLDEGKNRQIRRLLGAMGLNVLRLVRVSIGPLELGDLKKGKVRPLTAEEKQALDIAMNPAQKEGRKNRRKNNGRMPKDVG